MIVSWEGELELLDARWSSRSGRTVEFRIVETNITCDLVHPFKTFQRKRGNRVGQRFSSAIVPIDSEIPAYSGELMLCSWTDSEKGKYVKFWIDDEETVHSFCGYNTRQGKNLGQFFMAAIVEIADDGSPVDQAQVELAKEPKKRKLSAQAHLMITSELFCRYLRERCEYTRVLHNRGRDWTPKDARAYVKYLIKVDSLADIDWNQEAAARFHDLVRKPFARYNGQE